MNIPTLRNMHPADRSELQQWCLEVVREFNALNMGRYQLASGKQIVDASEATVPNGLTTKSQLDNAMGSIDSLIKKAVDAATTKLKQDNNLV